MVLRSLALFIVITFLFSSLIPLASVSTGQIPTGEANALSSPQGTFDDFQIGTASANLTTSVAGSTVTVYTEEYSIKADWSTSFTDYTIRPYFATDYLRYRRANPQYAGDGTTDSSGNALDSVNMRITKWGRSGNTVWFLESCAEFSVNQTFRVYRDYFELDATYAPGTKDVVVTYFVGLYSSSDSLIGLLSGGKSYRYVPGYDEATPSGYGLGGWYPSFKMFAPACDMRVPGRSLGVEWGYDETVAYVGSPLWMKDMGTGGDSVFALKYTSLNSIVPNPSLGTSKTFHMFVRPYKYSDGAAQGHDVGYAQWVAPRIAAVYGNHNTPIFPLTVMDLGSWTPAFRSWVENSQVKLASYSNNPSQINWNYKSSQIAGTSNAGPSQVPTAWQLYSSPGTPMLTPEGRAVCNPMSGPYTTSGTFRWNLIQNDPAQSWWTGSTGVFWDEVNNWDASNRLRSDYQTRPDFLYNGYLQLIKESYESGYWSYVIANSFTGLLHLAIASDISIMEAYEPSTVYGVDLIKHVQSTMDFVNNIPSTYRPKMLVYQNYATGSVDDQSDVYSVLLGSAKYGYDVELLSYDSYDSQMHNLVMAEEMFKAMGCTRDSDVRITVGTLDLSTGSTLTTDASMVVTKGAGSPAITFSGSQATYKLTNLWSSGNSFSFSIPSSSYYQAGTNIVQSGGVVYSTDGRAKFSGTIGAEKTGSVVANPNLSVTQTGSGTATVTLQSLASGAASLTVASTGGTTQLILKGFTPGTSYNLNINSVAVANAVAAADGSLTFTRTFGANDQVTIATGTGGDTTAPQITQVSPANGATSVAVGGAIVVTFSEAMDKNSVQSAFGLRSSVSVSGTFAWSNGDKTATFTTAAALSNSTQYTVSVSTMAKDVAGNSLQAAFQSSFTTEAYVPTAYVPTAPLSPAASGGVRSITVQWSAPSSDGGSAVTSYKIYRGTSSGAETFLANVGLVTSYADNGLANATTYFYKISAANAVGEGALSAERSATTAVQVPSAPTQLAAVATSGTVTLTWAQPASNGGSAVTGYKVYRGTSPGNEALLATIGATTSYADQGLQNGISYQYRVSAVNSVGEGAPSQAVSVTPMTTPSAPSGLGLVPGNAAVSLTWLAPSSNGGSAVTSYIVYRGTSQSSLSQISEVTSTATTDATPVNGVHYYYAIAARNSVGIGPMCSIADCTPAGTPSQPTNLVATASGSTILLSFTAPSSNGGSPITGYLVLRGTVAGGETSLATIGTATTYSDTSAVSGVKYFYKAAAINAIGTGAASNEASATVGAQSPPGIPTHFTGKYTSGVVKLTWSAPSQSTGITSYNVYRGTSTRNFVKIATIDPTTSYADASVVRDAVYYYRVTAVNPSGEGQPSSYASVYCYVRNTHSTISEQMFSPLAGLGSPAWILLAATCMCALGMVVLIPRSEGVREWWAPRNRKR